MQAWLQERRAFGYWLLQKNLIFATHAEPLGFIIAQSLNVDHNLHIKNA